MHQKTIASGVIKVETEHILYARIAAYRHEQAVQANGNAGARRHTRLKRSKQSLIQRHYLKTSFKTGGIIKKVYVSEGQRVRKGQLLAELDLQEIRAQTQQAEIGKEQAGIQVESARLALHHARGEIGIDKPIVIESILGTRFAGRVVETAAFGDFDAVIPEVEGSSWITGRNEFLLDPEDPLKDGFIFR